MINYLKICIKKKYIYISLDKKAKSVYFLLAGTSNERERKEQGPSSA